jgi:hypothetical protein
MAPSSAFCEMSERDWMRWGICTSITICGSLGLTMATEFKVQLTTRV